MGNLRANERLLWWRHLGSIPLSSLRHLTDLLGTRSCTLRTMTSHQQRDRQHWLDQCGQLLSLVGRIVTMDMATGQYIDKRDCFQYVEFLFICNSWRHSRARCNIVMGQIWPAGHNLPTLVLDRYPHSSHHTNNNDYTPPALLRRPPSLTINKTPRDTLKGHNYLIY